MIIIIAYVLLVLGFVAGFFTAGLCQTSGGDRCEEHCPNASKFQDNKKD
jgi:hypothetical protein